MSGDTPRDALFKHRVSELENLETERAALLYKLANIHCRIAAKKEEISRSSPIAKLPDDIGVEILKATYMHDFPHCRLDTGLPCHSPIAISHVSRWWRRLALSVPQIWTCVHVTPDQPDKMKTSRIVEMYLARSKTLPISISLCCYTENKIAHPQYDWDWDTYQFTPVWPRYEQAFLTLMKHQGRWKNCAIHALHEQLLAKLLKHMEFKVFPRLEYFELFLYEDDMLFGSSALFDAPNLRHLRISHIDSFIPRYIDSSISKNLSEVFLSSEITTTPVLLGFLASISSTLSTLTLSRIFLEDPFDLRTDMAFTLPQLRTLILSDVETVPWPLLKAAPALRKLHVSDRSDLFSKITTQRIIYPTIRSLEIWRLEASYEGSQSLEEVMTWLYSAFPNLQTLWLDGGEETQEFLDSAMETDEGGRVIAFPTLDTLVTSANLSFGVPAFVDWRARHGCPLRDVVVTIEDERTPRSKRCGSFRVVTFPVEVPIRLWDTAADKPRILPWNGEWGICDGTRSVPEEDNT